ncbi:hypothetical protein GGQ74_002365 [Desulfobaculum xiamenense]|uniref:Uncharacterized protein n=1 Tax=Desulfobaculum xiamenense TaxID=995050 RepID=A0A846QQB7_9BACT|nr:hypothetical protein [Desulfobaculum xiamenense]NJB68692.1 hypothetical protein [Desulfobaculum xiamenense]
MRTTEGRVPWECVLGALAVAGSAALLARVGFGGVQRFTYFVSGSLALQGWSKAGDYAVFFGGVAAFCAAFAALSSLGRRLERAGAGGGLEYLLAVAVVPALFWLGGQVLWPNVAPWLLTSSGLAVLGVAGACALAMMRHPVVDADVLVDLGGGALTCVALGMASGVALAAGYDRLLADVPGLAGPLAGHLMRFGGAAAALAAGATLCIPARGTRTAAGRIGALLVAVQIPLPLMYLIIIPLPWRAGGVLHAYPVDWSLHVFIGVLVVATYADLVRAARRLRREGGGAMSAVSPLCVCAALFLIKATGSVIPFLERSDYHSGEQLLPWWMFRNFGALPYVDHAPVRGLVTYLNMMLADLFGDGTTHTFFLARNIQAALFLMMSYPLLCAAMGGVPAAVALTLLPLNGLARIHLLLTLGLCVLVLTFRRGRMAMWLVGWVAVGTALVLVAPGQGGLLVLASMPLGAVALWRAVREERRALGVALCVGLAVAAILAFATPLGRMVFGAVRYGFENAQVNDVANSLPWEYTFGGTELRVAPGLWELIRCSFIFVPLVAFVALWRFWGSERWERVALVAGPVGLLMLLFVIRAAGRIGAGMSRPGAVSVWAMALLLPLVLFAGRRGRPAAALLVAYAFFAGIIGMYYLNGKVSEASMPAVHFMVREMTAPLHSGAEIGVERLGLFHLKGREDRAARHMERLRLVGELLGHMLRPGETYFDMTNHNAHYFLFERRVPTAIPAVYNMPHPQQQRRAVAALAADPPPLVLAEADNELHNAGTAALRAHLTYRHVLRGYVPFVWNGLVFMVRPDVLDRVRGLPGMDAAEVDAAHGPMNAERGLVLLDGVFHQRNLAALPASWGASSASLDRLMRRVCALDMPETGVADLVREGDGWRVSGPAPRVRLDLPRDAPLSGAEAGLLTLSVSSAAFGPKARLEVAWGDAQAEGFEFEARGECYIVPLDASPRWLLAGRCPSLEFRLHGVPVGAMVRFADAALFQRTSVDCR